MISVRTLLAGLGGLIVPSPWKEQYGKSDAVLDHQADVKLMFGFTSSLDHQSIDFNESNGIRWRIMKTVGYREGCREGCRELHRELQKVTVSYGRLESYTEYTRQGNFYQLVEHFESIDLLQLSLRRFGW